MKLMRLHLPAAVDNIVLHEEPEPGPPAPGEVKVRIRASSLNFHDLGVVSGRHTAADGRVPMSDGACDVVAVGEGVKGFKPGDRVISTFFPLWQDGPPSAETMRDVPGDHTDGFARQWANLPASALTPAPKAWSHVEAATLPCAAVTAWRALRVDYQVKPGDWVLVQGSGGVSVFALQLATAMGARVIATSSSDEKLERLAALGAEVTINYRRTPDWASRALETTGGRGVDLVVEVGGPGTLDRSVAATRVGGQVSLIGVLTGSAGRVATGQIMYRQLAIRGLTVGSVANQRDMVDFLEGTDIRPVIDSRFPLEDLSVAFEHQRRGRHFGKICIEI